MKIQILTTTKDKTYKYFDDNNGMRWFFTSDIKRNLCKQFDYFILKHDLFDHVEHITPDMFELDDAKYFKHQRKLKAINRKGLYLATKHDKKIKEFVEEHFADIIYYGKLHDEENALQAEVVQGTSQELAVLEQNANTPEIQIFANAEFGEVRTLMIDGEPWFVGKDVATILGYTNTRSAMSRHVNDEERSKIKIPDSHGRFQEAVIINESGLFSLVISSKLANSKGIRKWLSNEVLPNLKDGGSNIFTQKQSVDIQTFANAEFGAVRTLIINDEPWFVGKDVATILGYERAAKAIQDRVDNDDKTLIGGKTQSQIGTELGQRGCWVINESGLYSLILSSKLPEAKKFKRWVTSEVLPSLRKNGGYLVGQEQMSDMELLARSVLLSQKLMKQKDEQISNQQKLIEDMTPKSTYCDDVLQSSKVVSVSVIAKDYGMSAKQLNAWLREHKIQYKLGETWLLYQKYANNGYTKTTTDTYKNARDGKERTVIHTKWTQKGRMFIYEQLSKEGILPIMELSNCEV